MKSQALIEIINEMQGLVFDCTPADLSSGACIAATGDQLLATFNIKPEGTGEHSSPLNFYYRDLTADLRNFL